MARVSAVAIRALIFLERKQRNKNILRPLQNS